jgi:hypothetical protein
MKFVPEVLMFRGILFCLLLTAGLMTGTAFADEVPAPAPGGHGNIYYDWGTGPDGWGYCYSYNEAGEVLNSGRPVPNFFCEKTSPSSYGWGRATNGFGYCFQFSPYGQVLNQGHSVDNSRCEAVQPSYYAWGRAVNGFTYCFQFTPNGDVMNDGHPVPSYFCGGAKAATK